MTTICVFIHLMLGVCGPDPNLFAFMETMYDRSAEPTFAQMEWDPCGDEGRTSIYCEGE